MASLTLAPAATALVVIDLQKGIVGMQTHPRPASEVVANSARLARRFRDMGAPVVLVNVAFPVGGAALRPAADVTLQLPPTAPPGWEELVPELGQQPSDILITKRQWGAFYGTGLDMHLRRRGVQTIVLTGIATNIGVESTARDAYERGFHQVIVEDATASSVSTAMHEFAHHNIFPRIAQVRKTEEVLRALTT
ncbi:MAG: hydrolase [Burkholderiaceae bacterium]|nr:hydrolase [Burkholderiaceae bacterium]